jgi:hypothetical protein
MCWYAAIATYDKVLAREAEVVYCQADDREAGEAFLRQGYPPSATVNIIAEFQSMEEALTYGHSIPQLGPSKLT